MRDAVYIRTLQRALEIKGGADALARDLGMAPEHVRIWQKGLAPLPADAFLKIVDIVIQDSAERVNYRVHDSADRKSEDR